MSKPIHSLGKIFDVSNAIAQLDVCKDAWNRYTTRTHAYGSVHGQVDDVWVRYNAWKNFHGDPAAFNEEHESSWYPVVKQVPAVVDLTLDVLRYVRGTKLGGVLVTRIPPGGSVDPHTDSGWHASHYTKFAVQLKGNADQAFCFDDACLSAEPGELYTFDNSRKHWVDNRSDSERMTLIICIRGASHDFA